MNSRLTLLFVCDQSQFYSAFLTEFESADFQVLIVRGPARAKSILLVRSVNAIILCHNQHHDNRALAPQLKRIAPSVPVFLLTDQPQSRATDIDSVWRFDSSDPVVMRGMAIFCRNLFSPTPAFCRSAFALGVAATVLAVRGGDHTR
jgi:hypothetical protein